MQRTVLVQNLLRHHWRLLRQLHGEGDKALHHEGLTAAAPFGLVKPLLLRRYASQPALKTVDDVQPAETQSKQAASCAEPAAPAKSVDSTFSRRLLMRDFIQQSLYHPTKGFFNRTSPVVGSLDSPLNFWGIYCKDEFKTQVKKLYDELQTSFLTPAELFTPWYGYIMARHLSEHRTHTLRMSDDAPLVIMEIGGGNGTLARDILDWLRDNRPEAYAKSSYTCLEISTRLAAQQYETVVVRGGHGSHFHMVQGSAWDRSAWGRQDYQHTFVLMMEVLDNLPHDRVSRQHPTSPWQQTVVAALPSAPAMDVGPWVELLEPLSDALMSRCLAATYKPSTLEDRFDTSFNRMLDWLLGNEPQRKADGEVVFLPTACLSFLDTLQAMRPNHSLIAADFDMLPDVVVAGKNAPLVAEKVDGRQVDHDTILVPWGTADIFFPTDFNALAALYKASALHIWGADKIGTVEGVHYRQGEVTKRYKEMAKTATICSFNPMVNDFLNARMFFGDSRGRHPPGYVPPVVPPRTRRDPSSGKGGPAASGVTPCPASGTAARAVLPLAGPSASAYPSLGSRRGQPAAGRSSVLAAPPPAQRGNVLAASEDAGVCSGLGLGGVGSSKLKGSARTDGAKQAAGQRPDTRDVAPVGAAPERPGQAAHRVASRDEPRMK